MEASSDLISGESLQKLIDRVKVDGAPICLYRNNEPQALLINLGIWDVFMRLPYGTTAEQMREKLEEESKKAQPKLRIVERKKK